jgi:hypothetical protein
MKKLDIDLAESIGYWVTFLPETLGWWEQKTYRGHTLTKMDVGWRLILRATDKSGKVVAFFYADTIKGLFWQVGHQAKNKEIQWKTDLY